MSHPGIFGAKIENRLRYNNLVKIFKRNNSNILSQRPIIYLIFNIFSYFRKENDFK